MVMKLIVFDWKGPMGHFRKLDTNSSSLSYSFPSRITIIGMIAGMLGYERDSYYELFSNDKCQIGLSVRTPIRKLFQTVNYLFVKNKSDLNGINGHTQIPIEFLFPSLEGSQIVYRLYFWHEDKGIYESLKNHLKMKTFVYPPYMGLSELLSSLDFVKEVEVQKIYPNTDKVKFDSVVRISEMQEHSLELLPSSRFLKEFMTRSFDKERKIIETDSYLMEQNNQIIGILKVPYYQLAYDGKTENISFM